MRKVLLALGMAAITLPAYAQHHAHNYTVSVFDGYDALEISNKQAVAASIAKAKAAFPGFKAGADKLTGKIKDIYGSAMIVPGNTTEEKVAYLMDNNLKAIGINKSEWKLVKITKAQHATFAQYEQYFDGRKVAFSRLSIRFTADGRMQRAMIKSFGQPQTGVTASLSQQAILGGTAMKQDMPSVMSIASANVDNEWLWFPVPGNNGYSLQPAYAYNVSGRDRDDETLPVELTGYINAMNGDLLYRVNNVKEELDLVVKGNVYKTNVQTPATDEPLANLAITVGANTFNTNDTGYFVDNASAPTESAQLKLQGLWSTVRVSTATGTIPDVTTSIAANGTTFIYPPTAPAGDAHINAYYHTNRMHEFMKQFYPNSTGFTGLDVSLTTVVETSAAGGGCNAFYNGSSINFYEENAGCISFAKIGDVVYHEYGHGINGRFYDFVKGDGMANGGLNEGYADVWALSVTKDPVLGRGAFKGSGGNIRTYNAAAKIYPMNLTSEVHDNGEIIAGAWWDVGVNLGSVDTMSALFAKSLYDTPDGPEGTEGDVFHDALVSAVINDDNDADLANGTPHLKQIVDAFARHGIYMMSDAKLEHTEIEHRENESQETTVEANLALTEPGFFEDMRLIWRNRSINSWDTVVMTNGGTTATGELKFSAVIPGQPAGSIVDYYFTLYDITNTGGYSFPNRYNGGMDQGQVTIPYQYATGVRKVSGTYFDDVDVDWALSEASDNASNSGRWIQVVPIPSTWRPFGAQMSFISQTGNDHSTGSGKCLVTGNAVAASTSYNTADVDNGKTTVVSPNFDISSYNNPIIEYYRWFANDRGGRNTNPRTDPWRVQIRDAGSTLWRTVEQTYQSDYAWRRKIFAVDEFLSGKGTIQMRFIATDAIDNTKVDNGQNNIEAALDDFFIYDAWPTSVGAQPQRMDLKVFPNPADNTVMVTVPTGVSGSMSLYDMTGRIISTQKMDVNTLQYNFNTSALPAGQYMLMIQTDNKTIQTQKIAIKH